MYLASLSRVLGSTLFILQDIAHGGDTRTGHPLTFVGRGAHVLASHTLPPPGRNVTPRDRRGLMSTYEFTVDDVDIVLRTLHEPREFRVHKTILSIASPVLNHMFDIPQPVLLVTPGIFLYQLSTWMTLPKMWKHPYASSTLSGFPLAHPRHNLACPPRTR